MLSTATTVTARFTDVSRPAGIADPGLYGFGVLFSDLDDDGWPDIFVANDSVPNLLFRNNRNGTFSEAGLSVRHRVERRREGAGRHGRRRRRITTATGGWTSFVTNFSQDYNTLYRNSGDGLFSDASYEAGVVTPGLPYLGWGIGFVDFDNDGLLDIFVANGHVYPEVDRPGTTHATFSANSCS